MKIPKVFYISPSPEDTISLYRGWGPLTALIKEGKIQSRRLESEWIPDYTSEKKLKGLQRTQSWDWTDLYQSDVVILNRGHLENHLNNLNNIHTHNLKVIVDYDDDLFNLDKDNITYSMYMEGDAHYYLEEILKKADMIWVSTHAIRDSFLKRGIHHSKILLIPNAMDNRMFPSPSPAGTNKTVVWRGSSSQKASIDRYLYPIKQVIENNPEWELYVMGYKPDRLPLDHPQIKYVPMTSPFAYFQNIQKLNPEIGLITLNNTPFNRSRSNNAYIDYTMSGARVVMPATEEYFELYDDGYTYNPDDLDNFKEQFQAAINNTKKIDIEKNQRNLPLLSTSNELRYKSILEVIGNK